MGLSSLVFNKVKQAFKMAGQFNPPIVLTKKVAADFNFATQTTTVSTESVASATGIVTRKIRPISDTKTISCAVLFQTSEIGEPSMYSTATMNGVEWNVKPPFNITPYTTEVTLVREL